MNSKVNLLPLPGFYHDANCKDAGYIPKTDEIRKSAEVWKKQHGLRPVGSDKKKIHLLVIDDQFDFSFPAGSLYVAGRSGTGAMDAQKALVEFGYKYLSLISQITCTMDTHVPYQVFFNSVHLRRDGSRPEPNTIISADQYDRGDYRPDPVAAAQLNIDLTWLEKQYRYYCRQLEASGKYKLLLWPYHCLLGTNGHRLAGVVDEFRLFHSFARGAANVPEVKGGNPLTEHYSIFAPEVATTWEGKPIPGAQKNTKLIETLVKADIVIVAGLASSHCLKTSVDDFGGEIVKQDPNLAKKVYLLKDCTAAVVIPGVIDFTDEADKAFTKFSDMGMHVVTTTTPIESWPGVVL